MSKFVKKKEKYIYDLICVSNHIGENINNGRYTSYVKNEINNNWYEMNDSKCTQLDPNTFDKDNAYVLIYQKRIETTEILI